MPVIRGGNEAGYAAAFGLRDRARELCVGEFAMPEATVTTGLPRLTPHEAQVALAVWAGERPDLVDACQQPGPMERGAPAGGGGERGIGSRHRHRRELCHGLQ
jgi:hypothetical protein